MITLYTGIPGSGKSFKLVADLVREKDKWFVVHNIVGLVPGYLGDHGFNFEERCRDEGMSVEDFFTREYQKKLTEAIREKYGLPCLVIIDEASEWFGRQNRSLKNWLKEHRHFMEEIWMVAHKLQDISFTYRGLIEVEFRAKSGSILAVPGTFVYNRLLGGVSCGYVYERKNQEIFALYKSQEADAPLKKKVSLVIPVMLGAAVLGICAFVAFPIFFKVRGAEAIAKETGVKIRDEVRPGGNQPGRNNKGGGSSVVSNGYGTAEKAIKIEERFAFVGGIEGAVIVEERATGKQMLLKQVPGRYMVLSIDRGQGVRALSADNGKEIYIANFDRPATSGPERSEGPHVAGASNGDALN